LQSLVTCIENDRGFTSGNRARKLWKVLEYLLKVGETVGNIWRINCQRQACRTLWRFQLCRQPTLPINKYVGKHNTGVRVGVTESDVSLPSPRKRTRTEKTSDAATQLIEFFKRYPGLKKQIGGWIVRFYDPRALGYGPMDKLIVAVNAKLIDLSCKIGDYHHPKGLGLEKFFKFAVRCDSVTKVSVPSPTV